VLAFVSLQVQQDANCVSVFGFQEGSQVSERGFCPVEKPVCRRA